jgi:CHAT domain-containing protein/Tfp pilus assembly protein PilF
LGFGIWDLPTASADDAADLKALVGRFFAAYAREDLEGLMSLWSAQSPELATRRQAMQQTFAAHDNIEVKSLAILKITAEAGNPASPFKVRVAVDMSAVDAQTGKPAASFGKMTRTLYLVKENNSWKVWRYVVSGQELVEALLLAKTKEERARLLKEEKELVSADVVRAFRSAGDAQMRQQNFREARRLNDIAFEVAEALDNDAERAWCFFMRGNIFAHQSQYPEALENYQTALLMFREVKDRTGEARTLNNLSNVYWSIGNNAEARQAAEASLKIFQELRMKDEEARALGALGNVHLSTGTYGEALRAFEAALKVFRELRTKAEEATALNNIGGVYRLMGQYTEALRVYEASLKISREISDKGGEARTLNNTGIVYWLTCQPAEALQMFEATLKIGQETGDRGTIAGALSSVGKVSPPAQALQAFEASRAMFRELGMRAQEAEVLNNIGGIYERMGQPAEALQAFEAALKVFREVGMKAHEAGALINIGIIYSANQPEEALKAYEASLTTFRESGMRFEEATALNNIANVYEKQGQYAEALRAHKASLQIKREIGNKAGEATSLNNIGVIYRLMGNYTESLAQYEAGRQIADAIGFVEERFRSHWGIGDVYKAQRQFAQTAAHYSRAVELLEQMRRAAGVESLKVSFFEQHVGLFGALVECRLALRQNDIAFADAESSRARALLDLLAERKVDVRKGANPELLQRERELVGLTAAQALRLRELKGGKDPDAETVKALQAQLLDNERQLQAVQIQLRGTRYAMLQYPQPLTVVEAQKLLPPDTALLAYYVMKDETVLWAATAAKVKVYRLKVTAARLQADIAIFRKPMERAASGSLMVRPEEKVKAHSLYQQLIAPARADLKGIKRLVIVPHRALFYLPFAALEVGEKGKEAEGGGRKGNGKRYLIEDYGIVVVPSATALRDIRSQRMENGKWRMEDGRTLLAFAPFAEEKKQLVKAAPSPTRQPINLRADTESPPLQTPANFLRGYYRDAGLKLTSLPRSESEAQGISGLFRPPGKFYMGKEATEARVKAESSRYRILHFATHGILDDRNPQYSGVALAEARREWSVESGARGEKTTVDGQSQFTLYALHSTPYGKEDGFLQTQEIFNLTLNADLVVLSACETALGREKQSVKESNAEGFIGLTRGFLYAGTPTVVVSLWKVNDASTAELMKEFYKQLVSSQQSAVSSKATALRTQDSGLRTLDKAEALRQAQLRMLRSRVMAHPYYWAAFVTVGDWR